METRNLTLVVEALIQHSEAYSMKLLNWTWFTLAILMTFSLLRTFLSAPCFYTAVAVILQMYSYQVSFLSTVLRNISR